MPKTWEPGEVAIYYGDKLNDGQYDNGVWMDLLDIPYIQKIEEAALYKTVIRTLWLDAIGWSKAIKERYPDVLQIGLVDHPLSSHISKLDSPKQHGFIKDLEYLDGIMALTSEEQEFYSVAVPSIPVIKAGLPFPFHKYDEKYGHLKNLKDRPYIGLGVGANDNDRNFISNLLVFNSLRQKYPDLKGVFLSIPHNLIQYCVFLADKYPNVFIHERVDMGSFYELLAQCQFVINMADRNTPGRLQGEAAYFGVPVVGSDRLELQNELWPRFSTTPYSLQKAVDKAELILTSDISKDISTAYKNLEVYNYENSRKLFNDFLNKIKG